MNWFLRWIFHKKIDFQTRPIPWLPVTKSEFKTAEGDVMRERINAYFENTQLSFFEEDNEVLSPEHFTD